MEQAELVSYLRQRFDECCRNLRGLYHKRQELEQEIVEAERLLESTRVLGQTEAKRAGLRPQEFSEYGYIGLGQRKVRIADACYEILREAGQGLPLKELHRKLVEAGFESRSTDPVGVVGKVLDRDARFAKPRPRERFYQLSASDRAAKAPPG